MINLRFGARALPLNPIVCRKVEHVYRCRTTFLPSAITDILWRTHLGIKIFNMGLVHDTDILEEAPLRLRKTFVLLTFTWIVFFVFVSFFYSIKEYCNNLVNPNMAVQSPFFIVKNCICRRLCIWGGKLAS